MTTYNTDALTTTWGLSSAGRALRWQRRGRRFDPDSLHHPSFFLTYTQTFF